MPLEAVMICIDNSDYTRNGDYAPTRFESQIDAVNRLCRVKTDQNPENSVGLLSNSGDRIEVMITPTTDLGKMTSELPKLQIGGAADLLRGIQTAQLALKHRQNKNQKQRIIAFVSSPVSNTDKELETLGKNLKKNNVSLDLISLGEVEENNAKLDKLLNAVNSNDSSHILEVPVGPKLLSDVIQSSVIVNLDGAPGGGAGGGEGFEFGIDPEADPELALALRISMEEENARHGGGDAAPAAGAADAPAAAPAAAAPAPAAGGEAAGGGSMPMASDAAVIEGMEDMDEELRQALLLSLQEAEPMQTDPAPAAEAAPAAAAPAAEKKPEGSLPAPTPAPAAEGELAEDEIDNKWFEDPSFVQELLGSLPGVDINDPRIQNALHEVAGDGDKDKDKKEGEGEDKSGNSGGGGSSK